MPVGGERRFGAPPKPRSLRAEKLIGLALALCAGITLLVMVVMVAVLLGETLGFFTEVSPWEFFTASRWTPLFREKHFGILPLLGGSGLVVVGAGIIALPVGLLTAVYLGEFATPRGRLMVKPMVEALAGIPTVVYGYFALTLISPLVQSVFSAAGTFNALSASLALGIMVLPTVASLSEEALRGVSPSLREAAYALGCGRVEAILRVVLPAALPGIVASFVLALSRALGETMVVAIAAGGSPNLTLNPLDAVQTLTAYLLQAGQGNVTAGTLDYRTFFAVGMTLFLMTMVMNSASQWVLARFGKAGAP